MNKVPTFTAAGFIDEPVAGMSELMTIYFANKHSQSDLFKAHSIAFDLAQSPDDTVTLNIMVKNSLSNLYGAYFPEGVDVEVKSVLENQDKRHYRLQVDITCVSEGRSYSLGETYANYSGGFKAMTERN